MCRARSFLSSKEDFIDHKKTQGNSSDMSGAHLKDMRGELEGRVSKMARKLTRAQANIKNTAAEHKAEVDAKPAGKAQKKTKT